MDTMLEIAIRGVRQSDYAEVERAALASGFATGSGSSIGRWAFVDLARRLREERQPRMIPLVKPQQS